MKNDSVKLGILALLIVGVGYWYFFTGNETDPSLVVSLSDNQAQTQFQTLMSALPSSFDTSIFEDPRFLLLVDLTTPVTPETSGRPDPFAVITGVTE